ncbi:MAG: ThiF family adenylyltransferase [Opitutae bacterium]|nr:ThiF family adenylyltransferase [Opitutae bacterium]
MNEAARRENARMLGSLLGLDESAAAEKLAVEVAISHDPADISAGKLARQVARLLNRSLSAVLINAPAPKAMAELVIGNFARRTTSTPVYLTRGDQSAAISLEPLAKEVPAPLHPIGVQLCACYAAGALFRAALPPIPSLPAFKGAIKFDLSEWIDDELHRLDEPIDIGRAYLAGAGAVGNGFAVGLACFPQLRGTLVVCDDDHVSEGNMQRCDIFEAKDINSPKADVLVEALKLSNPSLQSIPFKDRLQSHPDRKLAPGGRWLKTLITGVDSRRARRELQKEIPGEVFDASTSGAIETVFHHHKQPTENACLACIYYESPNENAHEEHVAEALGVPAAFVKESRISDEAAELIATKYPQLNKAELAGTAYDTWFKQLCGSAKLKSDSGKQVLTPFAFVSSFAGLVMALELVLRKHGATRNFNEWRLSPWSSPVFRMRRLQERHAKCEVCSNPILRRVAREMWTT